MAKFVYRMQSILSIKEKLEEQAKMEFAAANAKLQEEIDMKERLSKRLLTYEEEGIALRSQILDRVKLSENASAQEFMRQAILQAEKRIMRARAEVEIARKKLQEQMMERKTHEKLKEKAFEQFKADLARAESKETDELVSYVYGRKAVEGD